MVVGQRCGGPIGRTTRIVRANERIRDLRSLYVRRAAQVCLPPARCHYARRNRSAHALVDVALGGALTATGVLCLFIRLAIVVEPVEAEGICIQCRTRPASWDESCSEACAEDYDGHSGGW